jgi:GNAT superfamily N-acetyltransferase
MITDEEIEAHLAHYGVKGMHWGQRKSKDSEPDIGNIKRESEVVLTTKLRNGGELNVIEKGYNDYDGVSKFMIRHFKTTRDSMEKYHNFTLTNKHGEKVGEANFTELSAKESSTGQRTLALEWIGVDKKHRRQGYGEATMRGVIKYAQDNDIPRLELTATQMGAPIYQKLGFKLMEGSKPSPDGWIEGDYYMDVPPKSGVKHSLNFQTLSDYVVAAIDDADELDEPEEDDDVHHAITPESHLAHYGVKGMHWGEVKQKQAVISKAEHLKNGTKYKKGFGETIKTHKAYADRQGLESGDFHRKAEMGKAYLEGRAHEFKKNESLSHAKDVDGIMKDVVGPINPEFGKPGTTQNCRRATFAYEMRRRGYDVKATYTTNASGQHIVGLQNALTPGQDKATRGLEFMKDVNKMMKDTPNMNFWGDADVKMPEFDFHAYTKKLQAEHALNDKGREMNFFDRNVAASKKHGELKAQATLDTIKKQGDGARGELGLAWMLGGGHSVAYEVVKGKPVVFDTQSGKKYETAKELSELVDFAGQIAYTRLDNRELNMDYLTRWVQDA